MKYIKLPILWKDGDVAMLEELGIETQDGFLCHIGPDSPAKLYKCKDLREPLKVYLDHNRTDLDIFDV